MSDIKERILGAISIMSDKEAAKIWDLILAAFALENAEGVQPDEINNSFLSEPGLAKDWLCKEDDAAWQYL